MKALTIGRAPDNSLVIDDPQVSRYHARLYNSAGKWYIADLNSTHGTTVNGKKVEGPVSLKPSDKILISEVMLYFDGRAILSAKGKQLLSLTAATRPAGITPNPVGYQSGRSPAVILAVPSKRSRVPLLAGLSLILILIIAIVYVSTDSEKKIAEVKPATFSPQPQPVIEYTAIPYEGGEYTGWLKDGRPHGQGTLRYPDLRRSSAFVDLLLSRDTRAKTYVGEWRDGLKHGYGKMTYPDGRIEEGLWNYGQFTGQSGN